jgi:hypothetical protein
MSTARAPGPPRPRPPPPSAVARELVTLDDIQLLAPDLAMLQYLRSIPAIASEIDRLEAERHYRALRAGGIGSVEARRLAGERVQKDERTLQRWGLTG